MLTEDQIAEFKAAFDLVDKDSSGTISLKELECVMRLFGQNLNQADLKDLIIARNGKTIDKIDFSEFLTLMS